MKDMNAREIYADMNDVLGDYMGYAAVTEYMNHQSLKKASHPPSSPALAPPDFDLFGYGKHQLQGYEFTEGAEPVSAISEILN
jgi:hypothetical protein